MVVDYVRSCFEGRWRFFPQRPDLLTAGYHFFVDTKTKHLTVPHPFGSGVWEKDGVVYPPTPVGEDMSNGHQWYDGQAPVVVAPDRRIFLPEQYSQDFAFPPVPPIDIFNGFDSRCWVNFPPGFDLDLDRFFRPNIEDCCWQRLLARLLDLLVEDLPTSLIKFRAAIALLWGDATNVVIEPVDTVVERFAWINTPAFQVVFRVGTQTWEEIWSQSWHGLQAPRNFGTWSTSPDWFNASTQLAGRLQANGFNPDKPMTFVGHSRGAATVWILARRMTDNNALRSVDVLTFESPKVGDSRLVRNFNIDNSRHIINDQDVVPLIPPNIDIVAQIRAVFPGIPLDPMTQWRNFALYQIIGNGRPPRIAPADALPRAQIIAYLLLVINNTPPAPIAQHQMTAQVNALAACCNAPIFPFTDALWQLLFGIVPGPAAGGPVLGGGPGLVYVGDKGLKLGGGGVTLNAKIYTNPGADTFTWPVGVSTATVRAWGAGSLGGPHIGFFGGLGGGGGAYAESVVVGIPLTVYPVHVGDGTLFSPVSNGLTTFNATIVVADCSGHGHPGGLSAPGLASRSTGSIVFNGGFGGQHITGTGGGGGSSAGTSAPGNPPVTSPFTSGAIAPSGGGDGGDGGGPGAATPGEQPGGGGGGQQAGGGPSSGFGGNGLLVIEWAN